MTDRPLGLIDLDQLVQILPDLIADALRQRETRPAPDRRATLTKATGVVTTAGMTTAEVQLDEDEPGVLAQVQLANAVNVGDRVVVLVSPGGSAVAIGNGNAQAVADAGGGGDSLWEINSGVTELLQPKQALLDDGTIEALWVEIEHDNDGSGDSNHHTYFAVAPAIGGGGGDIQAETYIVGHDAVMDWFFWSRFSGSDDYEAGSFFDAIGDDGSGGGGEAYLENFAEGTFADVLLLATGTATSQFAEIAVIIDNLDTTPRAYIEFWGEWNLWTRRTAEGLPMQLAPDAALTASDFTFALDDTPGATKILFKAKDSGGTVRTGNVALT